MESVSPRGGRLVRVQAVSGLIFVMFLVPHLVNQALAALGPAAYDGAQAALRRVYQWPPVEAAILGSLLVHAGASTVRLVQIVRRRALRPRTARQWAHRLSGVFLLLVFLGHTAATRGASLLFGVWPGFAGVAFTLRWVPGYFWPYYVALGAAGAVHAAIGLGYALGMAWPEAGRAMRRWAVVAASAVVLGAGTTVGVAALGGLLFDVGDPERSAYAGLLVRLGVARGPLRPAPLAGASRPGGAAR